MLTLLICLNRFRRTKRFYFGCNNNFTVYFSMDDTNEVWQCFEHLKILRVFKSYTKKRVKIGTELNRI